MKAEKSTELITSDYDSAAYLRDDEEARLYLENCFENAAEGGGAFIAHALGVVIRARNAMSHVAEVTGLSRESLYKALSGNRTPSFGTILRVLSALNLGLRLAPVSKVKLEVKTNSIRSVQVFVNTLETNEAFGRSTFGGGLYDIERAYDETYSDLQSSGFGSSAVAATQPLSFRLSPSRSGVAGRPLRLQ